MNNDKRSVSRYLYIAAVAIISLAAYVWAVSSMANHQQSPYALDKVSETPIPKWDFFSLWNDSLASSCNTVAKQLGMKPQACRTAIVNKRMECYKHSVPPAHPCWRCAVLAHVTACAALIGVWHSKPADQPSDRRKASRSWLPTTGRNSNGSGGC